MKDYNQNQKSIREVYKNAQELTRPLIPLFVLGGLLLTYEFGLVKGAGFILGSIATVFTLTFGLNFIIYYLERVGFDKTIIKIISTILPFLLFYIIVLSIGFPTNVIYLFTGLFTFAIIAVMVAPPIHRFYRWIGLDGPLKLENEKPKN